MNIYYSRMVTNCNVILVIQILTTVQTFLTNFHWQYAPPGTSAFLIKAVLQCVISITLIHHQKKNPTLKKSFFILFVSFFTGHFSIYWIGFYLYISYLGWALIIAAIALIINQRKYDKMLREENV